MELDKRIKEGNRPLTCFDAEEAKQYINKRCYFANADAAFSNLDNVAWLREGILTGVFEESEYPFCSHGVHSLFEGRQIVPCEWVTEEKKEPKYRPYTISKFLKKFKLGDSIILRHKGSDTYEELLFTGYSGENVHLGACVFGFNSLFNSYEFGIHYDEFEPFGVLEE